MIYGFHLSAQGARAQSQRLDVIANNLANAGTTAFKKAMAVFQDNLPYDLENGNSTEVPGNLNAMTGGLTLADIVTDFSQGQLKETGRNLDIAITGDGFLQVADAKNQRYLTRNGNLGINAVGELVVQGSGHKVLNTDGEPIRLTPGGGPPRIAMDGTVTQGQTTLGRLALVTPGPNVQMKKIGDSLYTPIGAVQPSGDSTRVRQGFLESSGTNAISEMLSMIQASRAFETNINMIRIQDESMSRLLQSLPRR